MEPNVAYRTLVFSGRVSCRCANCREPRLTAEGFFLKVEVRDSAILSFDDSRGVAEIIYDTTYLFSDGGGIARCLNCGGIVFIPMTYDILAVARTEQMLLESNVDRSGTIDWVGLVPCYVPRAKYLSFAFPLLEVHMEASGHA